MKKGIIRLVQLKQGDYRCLAMVDEPDLIVLNNFKSVYDLALFALEHKRSLSEVIGKNYPSLKINYDEVYNGTGTWKLLPAFDCPDQPLSCLVSGTGLTHRNSALNRQMMHQSTDKITDSMTMYQWGLQGGCPEDGQIGVQPEWFYKGHGGILKGHGDKLDVPAYANDGGEEPEIAGVYIIDSNGNPFRIGFTTGNEFSDHVMEKKNYLYLAPSKLRQCAIGPEIALIDDFSDFWGKVSIIRNGIPIWTSDIKSGEKNMAHNLANLEYHHFKYDIHRVPFQAHVHFMGADAFSFGNNIKLQDKDVMTVQWHQLGRTLKNYVNMATTEERLLKVNSLV